MRYPHSLEKGEVIGFPAPSYGASTEPYRSLLLNAWKNLKARGYRILPGPNAFAGEGTGISNTPEKCAAELTELYCSPETAALISVGGGELMCEILPYLDFEKIKAAEPKWFCGYSDNTNFGFLLATLCDTASLYAPCSSDFGMEPWHESVADALSILTGESLSVHGYELWEKEALKSQAAPLLPYNLTEKTANVLLNWDGSPVSGRFAGGCLDCLINFCGTRFDKVAAFNKRYREDGIIWFLEACDLSVYEIRRALWHLREAGWFETAKGFLIGRPLTAFDQDLMGLDRIGAVTGVLGSLGVPIVLDADLGHLPPMMPMINGGFGTMSHEGRLRIDFEKK